MCDYGWELKDFAEMSAIDEFRQVFVQYLLEFAPTMAHDLATRDDMFIFVAMGCVISFFMRRDVIQAAENSDMDWLCVIAKEAEEIPELLREDIMVAIDNGKEKKAKALKALQQLCNICTAYAFQE